MDERALSGAEAKLDARMERSNSSAVYAAPDEDDGVPESKDEVVAPSARAARLSSRSFTTTDRPRQSLPTTDRRKSQPALRSASAEPRRRSSLFNELRLERKRLSLVFAKPEAGHATPLAQEFKELVDSLAKHGVRDLTAVQNKTRS